MPITAAEYAKGGKVDQATSLGLLEATARAADAWRNLPEAERTAEKAREIVTAAPMREDNQFLESAGTRELAQGYATNLMDRSEKLDEKQGVAKGTNLIAYMDDTAKAIEDLDKFKTVDEHGKEISGMDNAKNGKVPMSELNKIRAKFAKSAAEHLQTKGSYTQDFLHTIQEDEDLKDKKVEPKQAKQPNFMEMIVQLIGMFLGIDLGSLFARPDQTEEQRADAQSIATVSAATEKTFNQMLPLASELREGKNMKENLDKLNTLNGELTGDKNEKPRRTLTEEEAKEFGQKVIDNITLVRTGQKTEKDMGGELSKSLASAEPQKGQQQFASADLGDAIKAFGKAVLPVIGMVTGMGHGAPNAPMAAGENKKER